jgi:hypothetical protein
MVRTVAQPVQPVTIRGLPTAAQHPTIPLWPDAGQALGLSRPATYRAAARGEIPGAMRIGNNWRVATATLRKALGLEEPETRPTMGPVIREVSYD